MKCTEGKVMTETELISRIKILEIEMRDLNQLLEKYQKLYNPFEKIIGRIALYFDLVEDDRGKWTMFKDDETNIIYKTLGIKDVKSYPLLPRK